MPRIISIALRRPARSSFARCSDTSGGTSVRAVSVAIRRSLLRGFCAPPGIAGWFAGPDGRDLRRYPVGDEPTTCQVRLDSEDGRVRALAASPVAAARGLDVARVRRADGGRR